MYSGGMLDKETVLSVHGKKGRVTSPLLVSP